MKYEHICQDLVNRVSELEEEIKQLKEELVNAYYSRGKMYMGGEYETIQNRIKELKK